MNKFLSNIYFFFLTLLCFTSQAQNESFEWVKQLQGDQQTSIYRTVLDDQGNILTSGRFKGTVDFDPGPGVSYLVSNIEADGYLAKYSSQGNLLWVKQLISDHLIGIYQLILDHDSNIILCGSFSGTIDLNPGNDSANFTQNTSYEHYFLCKLDSLGNFLWAHNLKTARVFSIAMDEFDNIFCAGNFLGAVDFDPDSTNFYLNSSSNVGGEAFISKFNSNGQFNWVKQFESSDNSYVASIAIDELNNMIITGGFKGLTDFNPGIYSHNIDSNGDYDIFICKLDSSGTYIWAKSIGGTEYERSTYITTDQIDNIYITGTFQDSIDMDPGSGVHNIIALGSWDSFILKLDSAGNYIWSKPFQSLQEITIEKITFDPLGDLYTTGSFKGTVDFDPGPNNFTLSSFNYGAFINKLNPLGEFVWAKNITSENGEVYGGSICIDDSFEVYTTGTFKGYTDFGIGTPNQFLDGGIEYDGFIHKISQPISTVGLNELSNTHNYYLTPNPAANFTELNLDGKYNQHISIFDITGKLIEQFWSNEENILIDVSNYSNGLYFIQIADKQQTEVIKLVVDD